mgnify:CR=1 FL=1
MRFVDEFRDAEHVRALAARIGEAARRLERPVRFMEVCGGHTMAIHRFGIPDLLPDAVELLSGPGCPVCVTPTAYIDRAAELAGGGATVPPFGDLFRVPGAGGTLEQAGARGADVRIVYSPRDALKTARENPDGDVVFLAVGFETTAPAVAATVLEADAAGVENFRVLSGHKTMPGALRCLLEAPEVGLDGFILPGHVATVTGVGPFEFIPGEFALPCSITGFEPGDILTSILSLTEQCARGEARVDNRYGRAVRSEGNPKARAVVEQVFKPSDAQWRGVGMIEGSGLDLREEWAAFHAEPPDPHAASDQPPGCRCGEVLRGLVRPPECALFGERCTPETPVGPCMVSSEGSCAAHYKYGTA